MYYDGHGNLEGIRKGKWKLLVKKSQTLLFDLLLDVGEHDNLAEANPDVVKELAAVAGGTGGGRPHLAQAGTKEVDRLDDAVAAAAGVVRARLG